VPGFSGQYGLSIVATKFAGSIEGEYFPWIGARLDAEDEAALVDGDALDDEVPEPPDETQCVLITVSRPYAIVVTAAREIRLGRLTSRPPNSSHRLDTAIVAVGE
jgi:hypothetical protein